MSSTSMVNCLVILVEIARRREREREREREKEGGGGECVWRKRKEGIRRTINFAEVCVRLPRRRLHPV